MNGKGTVTTMPVKSKIGDVIAAKGLKRKWVAEQIGISGSYLSQICKNNSKGYAETPPNVEHLLKLSRVLACPMEELVEYVEG